MHYFRGLFCSSVHVPRKVEDVKDGGDTLAALRHRHRRRGQPNPLAGGVTATTHRRSRHGPIISATLEHLHDTYCVNVAAMAAEEKKRTRTPCMVLRECNANYVAPTTAVTSRLFLLKEYHIMDDDGDDVDEVANVLGNVPLSMIPACADGPTHGSVVPSATPRNRSFTRCMEEGEGSEVVGPTAADATSLISALQRAGSLGRKARPESTSETQLPSSGAGPLRQSGRGAIGAEMAASPNAAGVRMPFGDSWIEEEGEAQNIAARVRRVVPAPPQVFATGVANRFRAVPCCSAPAEVEVARLNPEYCTSLELARWRRHQITRMDSFILATSQQRTPSQSVQTQDPPSSLSVSYPEFMARLQADASRSTETDGRDGTSVIAMANDLHLRPAPERLVHVLYQVPRYCSAPADAPSQVSSFSLSTDAAGESGVDAHGGYDAMNNVEISNERQRPSR